MILKRDNKKIELEGFLNNKENEFAETAAIDIVKGLVDDEGLTLIEDEIENEVDSGVILISGIIGLLFIGFSYEIVVSKS